MFTLNKTIRYNTLLGLYGSLLSTAQQEILKDYYYYDLSISEIAETRKSSRAAVEDAIKKGLKKLDYYENELHLYQKNEVLTKNLSEMKSISSNENLIRIIDEIERTLK